MIALAWLRQLQRRCFPHRVIRPASVRSRTTLIADINTANSNGQGNTINLSASIYTLTTINNFCVVALDGVLPSAVMARTAHGLLASGVRLGLSASGTQIVESIDAQRLVVSA
jgi:hypothetical protein